MSDANAMQITMANADVLYSIETGSKNAETIESTKYYTASLRSMNKRLQDPIDRNSDGVLGAVLGFACHDVCLSVKISLKA
jgi:hypothetical protein